MMITKNYIAKGEGANRFEKIPVQIYETADEAASNGHISFTNLCRKP